MILAVLFLYVMDKISQLSRNVEETGIHVLLRNMQSNLDIYKAQKIISSNHQELKNMVQANPVGIIFSPPRGYTGEFEMADPKQFSPGEWYFDKQHGQLVYLVIHVDEFSTSLSPPARIRLQLQAAYQDKNGNGRYDPDIDRFMGLQLNSLEDYEWRQ